MRIAAIAGHVPAAMLVRAPRTEEDAERRQPLAGFQGRRFVGLTPASYNAEAHSVDAVLSAGTTVRRRWFSEELEISAAAIDLTRATGGLVPLLDAHNQWATNAVLGSITNVRVEGDQLVGTLVFGQSEEAREAERKVAAGELRGISVGYKVSTWEITRTEDDGHETWRARRWELLEVSLVPVPADAAAGIRASQSETPDGNSAANHEEDDMNRSQPGGAAAPSNANEQRNEQQPANGGSRAQQRSEGSQQAAQERPAQDAGEQARRFTASEALEFVADARALDVEERASELVQRNERGEVTLEAARVELMRAAADRQRAETSGVRGASDLQARDTNERATRDAVVSALVARATGGQIDEAARGYVGMSLLDLARERANVPRSERDPDQILRAAHTSSDFPIIMEQTGQRILLERYQAAQPTFTAIARRRNLRDFRPTRVLRVGDFPTLLPYLEDGEIKAGTIGESGESVQLNSFGRRLLLTRHAIVNDDIGAFDEVFGSIGIMIAQFENATFYAMKAQNNGNGPRLSDGHPVFHSSHGNIGAAAAMGVPSISAARAAIRKQKNMEGQVMNLSPRTLLVGPDSETIAEQITSPLVPQQVGNVNPFSGRLDVVAEGSIPDYSFELYADPAIAPVFVYGSLESAPGPRLISKESFSVDGMQYRVTYDFYADAVDYRGAYRNPGQAPA